MNSHSVITTTTPDEEYETSLDGFYFSHPLMLSGGHTSKLLSAIQGDCRYIFMQLLPKMNLSHLLFEDYHGNHALAYAAKHNNREYEWMLIDRMIELLKLKLANEPAIELSPDAPSIIENKALQFSSKEDYYRVITQQQLEEPDHALPVLAILEKKREQLQPLISQASSSSSSSEEKISFERYIDAVSKGDLPVVKCFMQQNNLDAINAHVPKSSDEKNPHIYFAGHTALHIAITKNRLDIVKALLSHQDAKTLVNTRVITRFGENAAVFEPPHARKTPLTMLFERNPKSIAILHQLLAVEGINVKAQGSGGNTELHFAIRLNACSSYVPVSVEALLKHKDTPINIPNYLGVTPLMLAASYDNVPLLEALLPRLSLEDITRKDREGKAAIDHASDPQTQAVINHYLKILTAVPPAATASSMGTRVNFFPTTTAPQSKDEACTAEQRSSASMDMK
jgi:ankyrin repeat protein